MSNYIFKIIKSDLQQQRWSRSHVFFCFCFYLDSNIGAMSLKPICYLIKCVVVATPINNASSGTFFFSALPGSTSACTRHVINKRYLFHSVSLSGVWVVIEYLYIYILTSCCTRWLSSTQWHKCCHHADKYIHFPSHRNPGHYQGGQVDTGSQTCSQ